MNAQYVPIIIHILLHGLGPRLERLDDLCARFDTHGEVVSAIRGDYLVFSALGPSTGLCLESQ